jgi:hypothetical protein
MSEKKLESTTFVGVRSKKSITFVGVSTTFVGVVYHNILIINLIQ